MLGRRILGQMRNQMRRKSYLFNSGPSPDSQEVESFAVLKGKLQHCFKDYGKTPPRGLVFLCGDAHDKPPYLCDLVGHMIVNGELPYQMPTDGTPFAAFHIEEPGNSVGLRVKMDTETSALKKLGLSLESKMVFGFEPLGFAIYSRLDEDIMSIHAPSQLKASKMLEDFKKSQAYWTEVGGSWTEDVKRALAALEAKLRDELEMTKDGKADEDITEARQLAGARYRTAVTNARVPANPELGRAIQESIDIAARAVLHFVSVGNDHLEGCPGKELNLGETIIKHVKKMDSDDWLAISIGKGKLPTPEVKTIGKKGKKSGVGSGAGCVIA